MTTIEKQFINNLGIMSISEQTTIQSKRVAIVGLGGLGGHVANNLVRLGVGEIHLIDFDTFDESNINRQLFSNHKNLGLYKVDVIKSELKAINPNCNIFSYSNRIETIDDAIFEKIDYLIDAVDTPSVKKYIASLSKRLNKTFLHGACAGWYGQVGWITQNCNLIHQLYESDEKGLEDVLLNPTFTPSIVASMMAAEFVKYILNSNQATVDELLLIDILNNTLMKTGDKHG